MNFKEKLNQEKNDFVISLKEFPSLVDHAFQDMIVLPGSAYLEMALVIFESYYKELPNTIKNVNFENLILLSDEDTRITYEFVETSDNLLEIKFTETSNGKIDSDKSLTTNLFIESPIEKYEQKRIKFNISGFISEAKKHFQSKEFYSELRDNGNQYGPKFQNIKEIWIANGESLAKLLNPIKPNENSNDIFLNPSLIDSFTQLLSTLSESKGRTFILNSIKEIKILNYKFPEEIWCIASLVNSDGKDENEFEGNLQIFDSNGLVYLELNGVKFKYLEKFQTQDKTSEKEKHTVCISSTFTSDPLEDSLKFWDNYLDLSLNIQFAPYNQVFQELLNPQSLLSTNQNGYNVILLGLEDWTRKDHSLVSKLSEEAKEKLLFDKSRYTLPNHLEIAHLNKYETEYVYKEIFVDKCYLKHGITLNDGDTIIDIGANIGLFTLFVNQFCKDPEVFSFEPSPVVYNLLKTNSELYGSNVKTFNFGVSDKEKNSYFHFL